MPVDTKSILRDVREGIIPAAIYADPAIFDLERERVFPRSWCFLAHESEITQPGDYVVRRIVDDSFIVARDESGTVRVLLNMCLHRGMQVCRAERGNASHFRCPYHAWTYKNSGQLVGIPHHQEAYGGEGVFPKKDLRLVPAPKMSIHNGMIFACLDPAAEDLDSYLGDYRAILDMYLYHSEARSEFHGPQRWRVPANWKIASENFIGDSYHTAYTHASIIDISLFGESKKQRRKLAVVYVAGPGGGTTHRFADGGNFDSRLASIGYPAEMVERMKQAWTPAQRALIGKIGVMPSATALYAESCFDSHVRPYRTRRS